MMTNSERSTHSYRVFVVAALCFLMLLGLGGWLGYLLIQGGPPASVTGYEFPFIDRSDMPLCPGDTLEFRQVAHIERTPAMVVFTETVVDAQTRRTVVPDDTLIGYNHRLPTTIDADVYWLVPDLPAGTYELLRSTTAFGRSTEMYAVLFTVKENC